MKTKQRKYKYLGRRVENIYTGTTGRIARATPREDVKRGWRIYIVWDDGHGSSMSWTDREVGNSATALNKIVPDDYDPDHGPIPSRMSALMSRIDEGNIPFKYGNSTTVYVGKDSIGIWRPVSVFRVSANLWARQGKWEAEGRTPAEAWAALKDAMLLSYCEMITKNQTTK